MKKLICLIVLSSLCILPSVSAETKKTLFVMLDVDNTITDRIDADNVRLKDRLIREGFCISSFDFIIKKEDLFYNYYRKRLIKHHQHPADFNSDYLNINEIVALRPGIDKLLQSIIDSGKSLGIPVHILICSRKDSTRTNALINSLDLCVDGKLFRNLVEVLPRELFRVELTINGENTPAKSAVLLREKYSGKFGKINKDDYVILIDQLTDNRFVVSNPKKDLNVMIPSFEVNDESNKFDLKSDQDSMSSIVEKINNFLK